MLAMGFAADIIGRRLGSRSGPAWHACCQTDCLKAVLFVVGKVPVAEAVPQQSHVKAVSCLFLFLFRLTAAVMLLGGVLLTSCAGGGNSFLAMFLCSLFILGTGGCTVLGRWG